MFFALPKRFIAMNSAAARQDNRPSPLGGTQRPALCILLTPV
jgi:hypothetical protein